MKPVESGTVSVRVVFALGVSIATEELDEGVAKPLDAVTFPVLVLLRLKLPKRSPEVVVPKKGAELVALVGPGGMTPDAPVETVTPVSNPVVKLPAPPVEVVSVVGTGSVVFTVSVTTKVLPGGMTPAPSVLFAVAVLTMTVTLPPPIAVVKISLAPVDVTVVTSLDATTIVLVLRGGP